MIHLINNILNILFPPRCVGCRTFSKQAVCTVCQEDIQYINENIKIREIEVFCLAAYSGPIKKAICRLKFEQRHNLLPFLQDFILENIPKVYQGDELLIPVPLSKIRQKERGFNQAELLISRLAKVTGIELATDVVQRRKVTRPLFELHESERQTEIAGAFQICTAEKIRGRSIILFDDIVTTGATLNELAKELKLAGASCVRAWSLTRALRKLGGL